MRRCDMAASISGVVTDSAGAPLQGIYAASEPGRRLRLRLVSRRRTGRIRSRDASGFVHVQFQDYSNVYLREWFDDVASQASATAIELAAGEAVTGVDASLSKAGSIAGVVTDSAGAPLQGIYVYESTSFRGDIHSCGWFVSDHRSRGGSYQVRFNGSNDYLGEWFDDAADQASAAAIVVAAGEAVAGVDASLAKAGSIAGVVTDSAGAPLQGIYVYVSASVPLCDTAADGSYRIGGLAAGRIRSGSMVRTTTWVSGSMMRGSGVGDCGRGGCG